MATTTLPFSGDPEADELLVSDPLALLIGMLLDQQIPIERAFHSPYELRERMAGTERPPERGDELDATAIAEADPDEFAALFSQRPALHRFPGSMARRTQDLCRHLVECYGGQAERVWTSATSGDELFANVRELPGFGEQKARIFVALLSKRLGVAPPGWKEQAGPYGKRGYFSVADIDGPDALARVREHKRALKAQARAAEERPGADVSRSASPRA